MITCFHHVRASKQRWSSVCRAAPQAERALQDHQTQHQLTRLASSASAPEGRLIKETSRCDVWSGARPAHPSCQKRHSLLEALGSWCLVQPCCRGQFIYFFIIIIINKNRERKVIELISWRDEKHNTPVGICDEELFIVSWMVGIFFKK